MSITISGIRGIGPATVDVLAEYGFKSIKDLAGASVESLSATPGFSEKRSAQVISDAKSLLATVDQGEAQEHKEPKDKPLKPVKSVKKEKQEKKGKKKESGSKDKKEKKDKKKKAKKKSKK